MNNRYMITIDGIQHVDDENSTVSFSTEGDYSVENDRFTITYEDSELTGYAGDVTTLSVNGEHTVLLERAGKTETRLLVEPGERNISFYDVGVGTLSLAVGGAKIKNSLGKSGGVLQFSYALDVDSNVISENEITVTVRERA